IRHEGYQAGEEGIVLHHQDTSGVVGTYSHGEALPHAGDPAGFAAPPPRTHTHADTEPPVAIASGADRASTRCAPPRPRTLPVTAVRPPESHLVHGGACRLRFVGCTHRVNRALDEYAGTLTRSRRLR